MLDEKKLLNPEITPVIDLVRFENSIKQLDAEQLVQVKLSIDGKTLLLIHGGIKLRGAVDRPLIHQLGGRIWGNDIGYEQIEGIWWGKFATHPRELEDELSTVFRKNDLTVRYSTSARGEHLIYGIVTPYFVDVNQLEFRDKFLEQSCVNNILKPHSLGFKKSEYGEIIELFECDLPGFQTTYRYGLIYAKNNGYDAYKVNWAREVLICTNGLTAWRGSRSRWNHTKEIDLDQFIANTITEGIDNQQFLESRISESREKSLQSTVMTELFERLSLAQASKNRIINRLDIESGDVGRNEWALSQSMTWLGTHEKYIPFGVRPRLIDLGTKILEKSLDTVLNTQSHIDGGGKYGLILPESLRRSMPTHCYQK
jgi:hypothetical protein